MSDFNISIPGGESRRLKTGGKYCPADILVTAEGGGFIQPESEALTPELVYQTTRPAGWLEMPTPTDYECYCLGHLLPGLSGYFYVTVTFTGTCTIEFGTVVNGSFIAKESYTPTSGTAFSTTLAYNNYGDALADGARQYMVRIYGTSITKITFRQGTGKNKAVNIVDIVCGISCSFTAGDYNNSYSGLRSLQYLRFVGNGMPFVISGNFVGGCATLKSVYIEKVIPYSATWGYAGYAFYECRALLAVSGAAFSEINKEMNYCFYNTAISALRLTAKPAELKNTFAYSGLLFFDEYTLNTQNIKMMDSAFSNCVSLKSVTGLNVSSLTAATSIFLRCFNLQRLVFAGETTPGGYTISLTDTALAHDALVEMIASLPVATEVATITITGVPGAAELTDEEIAVATAKNWTITI